MADKKAKAKAGGSKREAAVVMPDYVQHRLDLFDKFLARQEKPESKPIKVTINGKTVEGMSHETTPKSAGKDAGLTEDDLRKIMCAVVKDSSGTPQGVINGQWDLERPLEVDCNVELCTFESPIGQACFWHSSAHILGHAMEIYYGGHLTIGPPIEDGFYYDMYCGADACPGGVPRTASEDDYKKIEQIVNRLIDKKGKPMCERIEVTREEALEMMGYNKFKVEMINQLMDAGTTTTVYRVGNFVDLCRGPHIPSARAIKAMACTKLGSAYWRGDAKKESLQRVYGISFPNKDQMKLYKTRVAEAKKRDHRILGVQQELFFFHSLSPGSCFFKPMGTRVYNTLVNFIKQQYWSRGYDEVITPNVFDLDLWEISGHAAKYKENLFMFECEKKWFGLKPMNCPGHCLMFKERVRSYRELPMRLADFGVLHRNELSGALSGLTRVRRFQQDDAHIFCTQDQISDEVLSVLKFVEFVYTIFGMGFELNLSTRPETFLGEVAVWDKAEAALKLSLDSFCEGTEKTWAYNPGDGAFYGPKIDIQVSDALGRRHQCATVQLDFQLPLRFDLHYTVQSDGEVKDAAAKIERPVIVHRAILGSVERSFAILTEHYGGKWPFWLSPRQAMVVPIHENQKEYGAKVAEQMKACGFYVDVDLSNNTLPKKILLAQRAQYNFILVCGKKELALESVNVRARGSRAEELKGVGECIEFFIDLVRNHK